MSRDGKLLDLETGKALERQTEFTTNSMGIASQAEEQEATYQERWAARQIDYLQKLGQSKEKAIETTQQALEEFYQGMGMTQEQAREEASQMVANVEGELDKPTSAGQSGKKVAEDFSAGLKQSTPAVIGGEQSYSKPLTIRFPQIIPRPHKLDKIKEMPFVPVSILQSLVMHKQDRLYFNLL
ncbi:hypothetical protein [Bacillus velezensis]|uniref:hypothetical protein n=1 Tax=Bacillus velezensis TaxID=492670 RepID=UPI001E60B530|nr:hypothetical protein [Bacillus velezensis]